MDVIRTQPGDTLSEILETPATAQQVSVTLCLNREGSILLEPFESLNRSLTAFSIT